MMGLIDSIIPRRGIARQTNGNDARMYKEQAITVQSAIHDRRRMEVYERWVRGTFYVSDVMSKPVRTVSESSLMSNAIRDMANYRIGCLVVTNNERPVGIITEADILRRGLAADLNLKTMKVGELMSAPLITIGEDATIEAAASMMTAKGIRRLPVLKKGKLVGIVTATDIITKEPVLVRLLDELIQSKRHRPAPSIR